MVSLTRIAPCTEYVPTNRAAPERLGALGSRRRLLRPRQRQRAPTATCCARTALTATPFGAVGNAVSRRQ